LALFPISLRVPSSPKRLMASFLFFGGVRIRVPIRCAGDKSGAHIGPIARGMKNSGLRWSGDARGRWLKSRSGHVSCFVGRILLEFLRSFGVFRGATLGEVAGLHFRIVAWLSECGVAFENYPFLQDQERGIWTTPNGDRVAWFKDPDGNVLSVSQHV